MMRGLVAVTLGQVTVLSLMKVTGILRGPQYPITSTSFWLHSPLHPWPCSPDVQFEWHSRQNLAGQQDLPRLEGPVGQEAPQDLVRLFHQAARWRQVRLSGHHTLMRKWTMRLRPRYL